ncbi:MAG: exonuclease domain-containing protein [Verrucomicrobia bacterium]|nr:exonuclease domain-containing protein [Verrucomicrobiota bacterium]
MSKLKLYRPLAMFDIEATGTNPQTDRIIDLAIILAQPDGKQKTHEFRLNPGIPIPAEATAVHGIYDKDVSDCPHFKDKAREIEAAFANADLAGFNLLRFDIPMLIEEFMRVGIEFDITERRVVDVQRIFHKKEPRDLTAALSFYCQEMHLGAHGALPDADATLRVLEAQLERYPDLPGDVGELDTFCNPRDPTWVDREGRLKWSGDDIVLNFGKKKGESLKAIVREDPGFVKWMLRSNFPRDVKTIIEDAQRGVWPKPSETA